MTVKIGTLGTRFDSRLSARTGNRTTIMARMLRSPGQPIFGLDTRRAGCGAMAAWSPLEFATLIPAQIVAGQAYDFLHVPVVAPSPSLLATERRGDLSGWRHFRERYNAELGDAALAVARAFVEAATVCGGLVVLLCAEPYEPDFADLLKDAQNRCHCHRFNLARRMTDAITADHLVSKVERVDLDAAAFADALLRGRTYEPRVRRL
ncbi:MAG: hypothetical protein JNK49_21255 [Planctomycetes bacterium]|nr:hypothetical protein [Planctomycetota bacterium]